MPFDQQATELDTPSARLWDSLDDSVTPEAVLTPLCGIPRSHVNDVMLLFASQSEQAAEFVADVPRMFRALTHQSAVVTQRCVGHVRGPIQWAETITAWSSGLGVDDVFVCGSQVRDFDVAENRLVVWLLRRLVEAGGRTDQPGARWFNSMSLDRIRQTADDARALLRHRSLRGIDGRRLNQRDLRRVATGRNVAHYEAALDLFTRTCRPFDATEIVDACDADTREEHRVIELIVDAMRRRGHAVPLFSLRHGRITSGRLGYHSPSDDSPRIASGITYGPYLVHTLARPAAMADRFADAVAEQITVATEADADRLVAAMTARHAETEAGRPFAGGAPAGAQSTSGFTQESRS